MALKEELQSVLKGEVVDDEATLVRYSRDASIFEVRPRLVVFPKDTEDLKHLVLFAQKNNISLTCRGGGSDMTGGPVGEGIVLDMTRYFNKIKEIAPLTSEGRQGGYAVAEPGVFYRDLEKEASNRNLLLPCFPASKELCTLGGMIGNNAGGEKTLRYGKTEDYVEQLKVVLADGNEYVVRSLSKQELEQKIMQDNFEGEVYRNVWKLIETNRKIINLAKPQVSKNSAGYLLWNVWNEEKQVFNLTKLLVGSQGTLGIVTEIKFRLVKPKKHSALLVMFLPTLQPLVETVTAVLKHKPETFELYDDHTLTLVVRFFFDFLKLLKTNIVVLAFQFLPEFFMIVRGGVPKLILLAEFTADSMPQAKMQAEDAQKEVQKLGVNSRIATNPKEIEKYLTIRRESFNMLRRHPKGLRIAPFIDDIIVQPKYLEEFLPKLTQILSQYKDVIYTIAGHAGDGNFHIIPLMNLASEQDRRVIPELSKKVYDLVFSYKGSMSAEHNDGIIRTPFLEQMYGAKVVELFLRAKKIFDPAGIFNPGKKVLGTMDYLLSHIAKE
jgi:FAD/FMN-containing dehydrogenase